MTLKDSLDVNYYLQIHALCVREEWTLNDVENHK